MFGIRDLLGGDVRDLRLWGKAAKRLLARRQIQAIEAACMPYAEARDRQQVLKALHDAAFPTERAQDVKSNWAWLKAKKRG